MTDITPEAVERFEAYGHCGDAIEDYVTLAARIAELEAQEKKSRGYRVGHIAGFNEGIRQAAKLYREGRDWDVFATADCAILSLIDKEPTP